MSLVLISRLISSFACAMNFASSFLFALRPRMRSWSVRSHIVDQSVGLTVRDKQCNLIGPHDHLAVLYFFLSLLHLILLWIPPSHQNAAQQKLRYSPFTQCMATTNNELAGLPLVNSTFLWVTVSLTTTASLITLQLNIPRTLIIPDREADLRILTSQHVSLPFLMLPLTLARPLPR